MRSLPCSMPSKQLCPAKQSVRALFLRYGTDRRLVSRVTLTFHLVERNKIQGRGIHGVTLARGRGWIRDKVAEMRVAEFCADFGALHLVGIIGPFNKRIL